MINLLVGFLLLINYELCYSDITSGTTLESVFLIHRHGDRTPLEQQMILSSNTEAVNVYIQKYGYGQLTDVGKRRAYEIGKFIRSRYNELLSPVYNGSELYLSATDSTRTKMTALTSMAAVYPPTKDNWSRKINWTPVPYTSTSALYDTNLFSSNCPTFLYNFYKLLLYGDSSDTRFSDFITELSEIVGLTLNNMSIYMLYDTYVSEKSLGIPLKSDVKKLWSQLEAAVLEALKTLLGDPAYIPLEAGILLSTFIETTSSIIAGNDEQRVRIYSAHDVNVYALMAASNVTVPKIPGYGSIFALELRKVTDTGKYVVLPLYIPLAGEPATYLQVNGCDSLLCDIDQFYEITSPNVSNVTEYRTKCGWSEDLDIDSSGTD